MNSRLICSLFAASLIASPVSANEQQTQDHLKVLLGELLHLEQQIDTRQDVVNAIAPGSEASSK